MDVDRSVRFLTWNTFAVLGCSIHVRHGVLIRLQYPPTGVDVRRRDDTQEVLENVKVCRAKKVSVAKSSEDDSSIRLASLSEFPVKNI